MIDFERTMDEIIDEAHHRQEMKLIKEQVAGGKSIILFGAGNCGHIVYRFLKQEGIPVAAFCDNKLAGRVDDDTSLSIIGVEDLAAEPKRFFILISVADEPVYQKIHAQLMELGIDRSQCLFMENYIERIPVDFLIRNRKKYKEVFDSLADEISRKVYMHRIKRVFLLSDISHVMSPAEEQYFDQIVGLTDQEVFVDCDAYIGDTAMEFIQRVNGKYRQIYMFEAEPSKYGQIQKNLMRQQYKLYPYGVWSENKVLCFDADGSSASKVSGHGTGIEVKVVALDNVDFGETPTFIKMDIEGAEKEALLGAKNMISEFHPKLAICVYHRWEDLFELPLLIKEFYPDYRLYIRHYSNRFAETVCYAI